MYEVLQNSNTIRILELQAGSGKDPLKGTLIEANLDDDLSYEAISYRWSNPDHHSPAVVICNDTHLPVGPNLLSALLQFRYKERARQLWIDQICINQTDEGEKLQQLAIMGHIYSKAVTVLIWLGPADEKSDIAMELFPNLVKELQTMDRNPAYQDGYYLQKAKNHEIDFVSLRALFQREWFSRVWTLQEGALGRKAEVWQGKKSFPFSDLEVFIRRTGGMYELRSLHWVEVKLCISLAKGVPEKNSVLFQHSHVMFMLMGSPKLSSAKVLHNLRYLDCSQPKDRVYSLLRFLSPALVRTIVQEKSLSTENLFSLVAMKELERGTLDFLRAAGISQQRITYQAKDLEPSSLTCLNLPSWTPDWTCQPRKGSYWLEHEQSVRLNGESLNRAGGRQDDTHILSFCPLHRTMHLSAIVIDKISECTSPLDPHQFPTRYNDFRRKLFSIAGTKIQDLADTLDYVRVLAAYEQACLGLASRCSYRYGKSRISYACRLTLLGWIMTPLDLTAVSGLHIPARNEVVTSIFDDLQAALALSKEFERIFQPFDNLPDFLEECKEILMTSKEDRKARIRSASAEVGTFRQYPHLMRQVTYLALACKGQCFFITEKFHYMASGPDITQPGDKICVIPGCCMPFVIRPKGEHYLLVGECFVNGLMSGEALESKEFVMERLIFE